LGLKPEKKEFFFAKKNQKTFATAPNSRRIFHHPGAAQGAKVFASFFKKKRFLAPDPNQAGARLTHAIECPTLTAE
jgi:hypothetical protein